MKNILDMFGFFLFFAVLIKATRDFSHIDQHFESLSLTTLKGNQDSFCHDSGRRTSVFSSRAKVWQQHLEQEIHAAPAAINVRWPAAESTSLGDISAAKGNL